MKKIFINHTNHPSAEWNEKQWAATKDFGSVQDFPFPVIGAEWEENRVLQLVQENCKKILDMQPNAVLCQGEFYYCYHLVNLLKKHGILVLTACSERKTKEWNEGGRTVKEATYSFVRFRKY